MCDRGEEQKRKQRRDEEAQRSTEVAFQAYERPLVVVADFKYLGRVMTALYDECALMVGDLRKARKRWARMLRILGREGADYRTSVNL